MPCLEVLKFKPIALEGIDEMLVDFVTQKHIHPEDVKMLPRGQRLADRGVRGRHRQ